MLFLRRARMRGLRYARVFHTVPLFCALGVVEPVQSSHQVASYAADTLKAHTCTDHLSAHTMPPLFQAAAAVLYVQRYRTLGNAQAATKKGRL